MKAVIVPSVVLLVFSLLTGSVSAFVPDYYVARFYLDANDRCEVYEYGVGAFPGRGRVKVRGLAVVRQEADYYWAYTPDDPNTHIWTYRGFMKANWGSNMLVAYMWASSSTLWLWDSKGTLEIEYLSFMGYYRNASNRVQLIRGEADIGFYNETHLQFISVYMLKGPELYLDLDFTWYHDEARYLRHAVKIWPI